MFYLNMVIQWPKLLVLFLCFRVSFSQGVNFGHIKSSLRNMMINPSEVYYEEDLLDGCFCNPLFSEYEVLSEVPDSREIFSTNVHLYRYPDVQDCSDRSFPALVFHVANKSISSIICSNSDCVVSCQDFNNLSQSLQVINTTLSTCTQFNWGQVVYSAVRYGLNPEGFYIRPDFNVLCNSVSVGTSYTLGRTPNNLLISSSYVQVTLHTRCQTTGCTYSTYVYFPVNDTWYNAQCRHDFVSLPLIDFAVPVNIGDE